MSKFKKPNWYPDEFVKADRTGWVYTKNHNEVLSAIGYLDQKLAEAGLDPDTGLPLSAPINTVPPSIAGTAKAGNTLTGSVGTWTSENEITYSYVWEYSIDNGQTWLSANSTTTSYNLTESNVDQILRFKVTAINSAGTTTVLSDHTSKVLTAIINPSIVNEPVLSGTAKAGNKLNVDNGTWSGTDPISYSYKWEDSSNGTSWAAISGQTTNSYSLTEDHVGKYFRAIVTGTNVGGSAESISNTVGPVVTAIIAPSISSNPVLSGTAKAGNTLTATNGTWSGSAVDSYSYAWEESTNNTSWSSYTGTTNKITLTESNVGKYYRIKVTAKNKSGSATATSNSIGPIITALIAPSNTAAPAVSGTAKAGNTLTTTDGTWSGSPTITYQYAWESSSNGTTWSVISGQTSKTLALTESHVGLRIRSKITATNSIDSVSAVSSATAVVVTAIVPPSNTAAPVLGGNAKAGEKLTVTNGTWAGTAPITYTYKWEESTNGTAWTTLTGTTGTTLTLTESHVGKQFRVEVTGTNAGSAVKVFSNSIGPVITALIPPSNTALPTVTGTAKAGNTLTTSDGTWAGSPTITYTYAWESSPNGTTWTPVTGQTNKTLVLTEANVGLRYRSKVTATNSQGNVSANSAATVAVVTAMVPPSNTAEPVLSGNALIGETLTVTNGTWSGSPTITYSYNWKSSTDGVEYTSIGNTESTYVITESDIDKTFVVDVTATNTVGSETKSSNTIGPVTTP